MWRDSLRSIYYIAAKDMETYYLKAPAVSWGIVFPMAWILAFYLRNPQEFQGLVPGLIAMTILFSATAVEAVVINLELRLGSLERLLLAPISPSAVLFGKILGGVIFGLMMTAVVTVSSVVLFELQVNILHLALIIILSLLVFSSLGALLCVLVREVFEAQTLLNLPRFLMIFLCGVVYPISAMPAAVRHFAYVLPLTYTVEGVQQSLGSVQSGNIVKDVLVLLAFIPVLIFPATRLLAKRFA